MRFLSRSYLLGAQRNKMPSITVNRLKRIIKEELQMLHEGEREEQGAVLNRACSELIKAIEKFKESSSAKAKSMMDGGGVSLENHLKEAEKMLKRITDTPKEFVDGPKQTAPQTPPAAPVAASPSTTSAVPTAANKKVSVQPNIKKKA